jgi:tetrahydromethanopterin S-methyltransferase subunit A
MDLLKQISINFEIMDRILVAGRLLSENKGIDQIVQFVTGHPEIRHIILCGNEVKGHMAGEALLALHKNGVDKFSKIVGASGPYPVLKSREKDIEIFRERIRLVNNIGENRITEIYKTVLKLCR